MPVFSANLGFLFSEHPPLARVAAAATAGFPAVELHWPYDVPADDMRDAVRRSGVSMLGLNTPVGNAQAGEFGLCALPGRESEFEQAFEQALTYGVQIGATAIHCMAGVVSPDEYEAAGRTFVANLRGAADKAAAASMTILLEPINHRDKPGYFLNRIEQAASVIGAVGRGNVKIMFDCYHTQITQGDLIRRLEGHRDLIGHVQIAAVPSRAEPDEGEVNYPEILRALDRMGYAGHVGAEYRPRGTTEEGLAWLHAWSGREAGAEGSLS